MISDKQLKVFQIQRKLDVSNWRSRAIDRSYCPSLVEFFDCHYSCNQPTLMGGLAAGWGAKIWTPQYLKMQYGGVEVETQKGRLSNAQYESESYRHKSLGSFASFVDRLEVGEANDEYLVASNELLARPEFRSMFADFEPMPYLSSCNGSNTFFWMGGADTITPAHHDLCNLVMTQIYGLKRWWIVDPRYTDCMYNNVGVFSQVDLSNPDYERFPLMRDVPIVCFDVLPGESIFIPVGWWHQVQAMTVSISLSFTGFRWGNSFAWN